MKGNEFRLEAADETSSKCRNRNVSPYFTLWNIIEDMKDYVRPDPFVQKSGFVWYDYVQLVLMTIFVVPIRFMAYSFVLLLSVVILKLLLDTYPKGYLNSNPITGWRRRLHPFMMVLARSWFFCGAYHWVSTYGKRARKEEAPILVLGPHTSFGDALMFIVMDCPSSISRIENREIYLIGHVFRYNQAVYVDRQDPNSRRNTLELIKKRAADSRWPQVAVFPEGTISNGKYLMQFKLGAFSPGLPVQPTCVRFPNRKDTQTWSWKGPSCYTQLWYSFAQFHNFAELHYLPVYRPSPEEVDDPLLFGRNVRRVMADYMRIGSIELTFDDTTLFYRYSAGERPLPLKPALDADYNDLDEIEHLALEIGFSQSNLKALSLLVQNSLLYSNSNFNLELANIFKSIDLSVSGYQLKVFINKIASKYNCKAPILKPQPHTPIAVDTKLVDVRPLFISLLSCFFPLTWDNILSIAFRLYVPLDQSTNSFSINFNRINLDDFRSIIVDGLRLSNLDVDHFFKKVDPKHDTLHLDQVIFYIENVKDYKDIFTKISRSYQRLRICS